MSKHDDRHNDRLDGRIPKNLTKNNQTNKLLLIQQQHYNKPTAYAIRLGVLI